MLLYLALCALLLTLHKCVKCECMSWEQEDDHELMPGNQYDDTTPGNPGPPCKKTMYGRFVVSLFLFVTSSRQKISMVPSSGLS